MALIHHSRAPVTAVYSVPQVQSVDEFKPRGLWVSVDDAWKSWCEDNEFNLADLAYPHVVTLAPDANVLCLKSAEDIDDFTRLYAYSRHGMGSCLYAHWDLVAAKYQGMIIAPHIWERRLCPATFWYYGWDCASGCIWDAAAVERIEPMPLAAGAGNAEVA